MSTLKQVRLAASAVAMLLCAPAAFAQFAVVDVGAIAQLIQQVQTMQEQLSTARNQLSQARQTYDAMRGGRGMEQLLAGTLRNYLPSTWTDLDAAIRQGGGAYGALAAQVQALINAQAVLSPQQLAGMSQVERDHIAASRRAAAALQALTREALSSTSARFAAIEQLIGAIPSASDQKAILDLHARIAAEQGMLQNEQTKLDTLYQAAQAEEWARRQRIRELAIADVGSLRALPPMGL